jgi:rare lipoprotein A
VLRRGGVAEIGSAVARALALSAVVMALMLVAGCASARGGEGGGAASSGVASYYAHKYHGRTTASGERFDMHAMTAAHRTLPFGTRVRVTNRDNGKSVVVRINDRGPFVKGRVIDLSLAAAKKLGMVDAGLAQVELRPIDGSRQGIVARAD